MPEENKPLSTDELMDKDDLGVEAGLLRLFLFREPDVPNIRAQITPDDFESDSFRSVYKTLLSLSDEKMAKDFNTVRDNLINKKAYELAGGRSAIISYLQPRGEKELPIEKVREKSDTYIKIILAKSRWRKLLAVSKDIVIAEKDRQDSSVVLADMMRRLEEIETETSVSDAAVLSMNEVTEDTLLEITRRKENAGQVIGLTTGFTTLDRTIFGLQPDNLIVLAARPAMGKTAFAVNIAEHVAMTLREPTLIFSMEMSSTQIGMRISASQGHVSAKKLQLGEISDHEYEMVTQSLGSQMKAPLYICDRPGLRLEEIRSIARKEKAAHDIKLIILDYIQLMPGRKGMKDGRVQEISEISRGLKGISKELGIPVIALSQLSRAVEGRQNKRPMLSDLRESGSIEQDADIVLFLYREAYYIQQGAGTNDEVSYDDVKDKATLIVAKNRHGELCDIDLRFAGEFSKFVESVYS